MICPTLIQEGNALLLNLLLDVAVALRKGRKSPCTHTGNIIGQRCEEPKASDSLRTTNLTLIKCQFCLALTEASVYKGYKRDKIEMRGDRAEMSDFPLYLNTVAGGLDCRNQAIGGFSFVVKKTGRDPKQRAIFFYPVPHQPQAGQTAQSFRQCHRLGTPY